MPGQLAFPEEYSACVGDMTALQQAREHFLLNQAEANAIERHMWPLTLRPPQHLIARVICLTDKYCSLAEVLRISRWLRLHRLKKLPAAGRHTGLSG